LSARPGGNDQQCIFNGRDAGDGPDGFLGQLFLEPGSDFAFECDPAIGCGAEVDLALDQMRVMKDYPLDLAIKFVWPGRRHANCDPKPAGDGWLFWLSNRPRPGMNP
jgi:hypothetical protein